MLLQVLNKNRRKFVTYCVAAALGAGFIGSWAGASAAWSTDDMLPRGTEGTAPADVISLLGSSSVASRTVVTLPEYVDLPFLGVDGIDQADARQLATLDGVEYWAAADGAGNICVIVVYTAQEVSGSACNTPKAVEESGVWLGLSGDPAQSNNKDIVALLLPDSAATEGSAARVTESPVWTSLGSNLVVATSADIESDAVYTFDRANGEGEPLLFQKD